MEGFDNIISIKIFNFEVYKWLIVLSSIALSFGIKSLFAKFIAKTKQTLKKRLVNEDAFFTYWLDVHIEKPIAWILILLVMLGLNPLLDAPEKIYNFNQRCLHLAISYHAIYLVYISINAFGSLLAFWASQTESETDDQLVPFATKSLKVVTLILGFLMVLQNLGVNVVSLLAGLGIGGLALALAAQETVANVFGSITILLDGPFKVGDHIKVADIEGTVEDIGFRSTRIRTFYNSVVTIPNSLVAKEKIDNMGMRPVRRFRQTLGIHYDTPVAKIEEFCENLRYLFKQHDKVVTETSQVAFNGYADSALNILTNVHLAVLTGEEELKVQQEINLQILEISRKIGVEFAYPTRTIYSR